MTNKFHIAKTPHQYGGMRWSVYQRNGNITLNEVARCPNLADATMVVEALAHLAKDEAAWSKALARASTSFTARTASTASSPAGTRRRGAGSAAQPSDIKPAS